MPDVEVGRLRAHYGTGGVDWKDDQPLLLFVHAAGANHSVWALQTRALAQQGWNVAALDLPGHGGTADDPSIVSIDDYADWTGDFVDALGESETTLVGHSMGACVAITLAARQAERAQGLAVIGAGDTLRVNPTLLADSLERPLRAHRFIAAYGHGRRAHFGGAQAPGVWMMGATLALLEHCEPAVLQRDFAACDRWRAEELVDDIRCPTLVISGHQDRMTPALAGRALADRIAGSTYHLIDDSGHMLMAEAPTEVTAALSSFLEPIRLELRSRACGGHEEIG